MQTRFILIEPSHAGNVGAVARAMKVMGFADLALVRPRWANVLRREETIQRASGALDVLRNAQVTDSLDEALAGMQHLCATAMTPRDFGAPAQAPRQVLAQLVALSKKEQQKTETRRHPEENASNEAVESLLTTSVAFLFGNERFGMSNADVYRCHTVLTIPTDAQFGSLNLAAAVQLIAYEWRQALGGFELPDGGATAPQPADAKAVAGLLAHWEEALVHLGFLDPAAPKKLLPRLNQLLNRAALRDEEIHILRGVAKAVLASQPPAKK